VHWGTRLKLILIVATIAARTVSEVWHVFCGSLESGDLLSVSAFCTDLSSVAMEMFSHSFNFINFALSV
jgi:hypothetical protein